MLDIPNIPNLNRITNIVTAATEKVVNINITRPPQHYLTVGFEVNRPWAMQDKKHYLSSDYGHCFFYLTKEQEVIDTFSYGPVGAVTSYQEQPLTITLDYGISEVSQLFRFKIREQQAEAIRQQIEHFKLLEGNRYTTNTSVNSAVLVQRLLERSQLSCFQASGVAIVRQEDERINLGDTFTPYLWYQQFINSYEPPIVYYGAAGLASVLPDMEQPELMVSLTPWYLSEQQQDPVYHVAAESIVHGSLEKDLTTTLTLLAAVGD